MFEHKSNSASVRRALLIGIAWNREPLEHAANLLEELSQLVDTLGIAFSEQFLIHSQRPQARYLVGSGKAEEIVMRARTIEADIIIFDPAITPAQQRNWEKLSKIAVIDREEVILDIFARRAHTREARLQVELARMEYSLPRLTRAWSHLSRQGGGGIGAMGVGETQLETDRRFIRKRIDKLKAELVEVRLQRATRRKQRLRRPTPHAAIVGYTNAGKSSLFHQLTGTKTLIEDKLFATLDTTTRPITLPENRTLLLTDTVGFVRKLPHSLVESFKATLEESVLADFLIHLLDAGNPDVSEFHKVTMDVLGELGANLKRIITVFNKVDTITHPTRLASLHREYPEALFISAKTAQGLDALKRRMSDMLEIEGVMNEFLFPQARYDLVSSLHRHGHVLAESYEGDHVRLKARIPKKLATQYLSFRVH